jgi:hypothetical protein
MIEARENQKNKSEFTALRSITASKKADNHEGLSAKERAYKAHGKSALVAHLHCHILDAASVLLPIGKSDKRLRSSLKFKDFLLTQADKDLPLSGHIVGKPKFVKRIENLERAHSHVWAKKVVVSNPKRNSIIRTVKVIVPARNPVSCLKSTI